MSASEVLARLERRTLLVVGVLAAGALVVQPRSPRIALGVVGGGALVGLAYWAIRGVVGAVSDRAVSGQNTGKSRAFVLVKFFTRHAILALAAYGMMARLELHPIGLLIGATAPALAAAVEAVRRNP